MLKFSLSMVALLAVAGGCNQSDESGGNSTAAASTQPEDTAAKDVKPPTVQLDIVTLEELQTFLAKDNDALLVCDFWSTSCQPCMKEFPNLVSLHKKYGDQIRCVSVSLDFEGLANFPIEKCHEEALQFLKQQQATFKNVIVSEDNLEVLDQLGAASIPFVDVYRNGKLLKRFTETENVSFGYEQQVVPFIEDLLVTAQ
jgi:thiol-disulfide isomerase/thioredoxin